MCKEELCVKKWIGQCPCTEWPKDDNTHAQNKCVCVGWKKTAIKLKLIFEKIFFRGKI